jgi:hypothetical protein
MSLDAFSVVVGFLALLEVALGLAAISAAAHAARASTDAALASASPRLALTVATLLAVAILSCPILYLLLASWVPRWPGIICVEGVRRIGTGSVGAPGWLPGLLRTLDVTKPAVVLVAGAWLVLRRAGAGHARVATAVAVALGLVAILDGAAQAGYVAIEKEAVPAVAGCCTVVGPAEPADSARSFIASLSPTWFTAGSIVLGAAALALRRFARATRSRTILVAFIAAAAICAVPFGVSFLANVAAPAALGLPFHHCAWCAFARAPETLAGAALFGVAVITSAWALVARAVGANAIGALELRLLGVSAFGFLGTGAMSASFCWSA